METTTCTCDNYTEVMNVYGYNGTGFIPTNPVFQPPEARPMQPMPMQGMQQPMQPRPVAPQPSGDPGWVMVQTVDQVEHVSIQPGQKAWIMVQNDQVFALRVADQMGLTTTDYYRFEKFDPKIVSAAPVPEYVTRQEFQQFVESLRAAKAPVKKKEETAE